MRAVAGAGHQRGDPEETAENFFCYLPPIPGDVRAVIVVFRAEGGVLADGWIGCFFTLGGPLKGAWQDYTALHDARIYARNLT